MLSKSVTAKLAALLLLSGLAVVLGDCSSTGQDDNAARGSTPQTNLRVLRLVKVCSPAVLLCVASAHP